MSNNINLAVPGYAERYINLVDHEGINKALKKNSKTLFKFLSKIPRKKRSFAYAEGKWTLKEVLQHIIDA